MRQRARAASGTARGARRPSMSATASRHVPSAATRSEEADHWPCVERALLLASLGHDVRVHAAATRDDPRSGGGSHGPERVDDEGVGNAGDTPPAAVRSHCGPGGGCAAVSAVAVWEVDAGAGLEVHRQACPAAENASSASCPHKWAPARLWNGRRRRGRPPIGAPVPDLPRKVERERGGAEPWRKPPAPEHVVHPMPVGALESLRLVQDKDPRTDIAVAHMCHSRIDRRPPDVWPARARADRRLPRCERRLERRAENCGDLAAEQAPKGAHELQRAAIVSCGPIATLRDPNHEVAARTDRHTDPGLEDVCHPRGLADERPNETGAGVKGLVQPTVGPRRAATGSQHERRQATTRRCWLSRHPGG